MLAPRQHSHRAAVHTALPGVMGAVFAVSGLRALILSLPLWSTPGAPHAFGTLLFLVTLFALGILTSMSLFGIVLAHTLNAKRMTGHVEMRLGEPAANPYLYMAANIAAGADGIRRGLEAPPPVEADPYAAEAPMLPTSLADAVSALDADDFYRKAFGDTLVDYLLLMKRAELARYEASLASSPPAEGQDVSDWEMREYFEFF